MRAVSALRLPVLIMSLPLLLPADVIAQQDSTRITVRGVVGDASQGTALRGAVASIPELRIRTLTDDQGRFVLQNVPRGNLVWRFQMLGYADWEEEMELQDDEFLRVGLLPRPILLENIAVAVDRLERRRKAVPYSIYVLSRDEISRATSGSAYDLVVSRSPVPFTECPPPPPEDPWRGIGPQCIYSRGRTVAPEIVLDEEPTPTSLDMLASFAADEIHTVEYYQYATHIRVYTRYFVSSGKPLLPLGAALRRRF